MLAKLFGCTASGGGIAIIDSAGLTSEPPIWQAVAEETIRRWLGPQRRAGSGVYVPPKERYEDIVSRSDFREAERHFVQGGTHMWTIEEILGFLYSTSYAARRFFGDVIELFEAELESALLAANPTGVFAEERNFAVITAFKRQ